MERIFHLFQEEGFKVTDFGCNNLDRTFSKGNIIFAIRRFSDREDLQKWDAYQDEINRHIYLKVDPLKRLDIYFILFISFTANLQDVGVLHRIEKDPYYCRKIIIRNDRFEQDKIKLPFLSLNLRETHVTNRAKTIKEFLDLITKTGPERVIAERIFELKDDKAIAKLLIDFSLSRRSSDETP